MWSKRIQLELVPIFQIKELQTATGTEYLSEGIDPRFEVRATPRIEALAPGWYLFSIRLTRTEGELIKPCLYPDYGQGASEESCIELPEPDAQGRIEAVVMFHGAMRSLRFDPTIRQARFRIGRPVLKKISRARALLTMLLGIQKATRCLFWEDALQAAWSFARHAVAGRLGTGASHVVQGYLAANRQVSRGYAYWLKLFGPDGQVQRDPGKLSMQALSTEPLISIILPTHNTPLPLLRKCIESVLNQSYAEWQLCIADDASTSAVQRVLQEYAERDSRIRLHLRAHHGHICETSNDALSLATGAYVGFLDHDDELARDALYEVACAIQSHPDAGLFYTDEDKLDESGRRFMPNFKPAWNPDLLRSQNYICHFAVLRADLVRSVGGLRAGFEGAQDHDLLLRCVERLQRHEIVHIPKVLYHWRALPGSTSRGLGEKTYAQQAGLRAVEQHLARIGLKGEVQATPAGYYRVRYELGPVVPAVSLVIPTRDRKQLLSSCIDSILEKTAYANYDIVVVDNGSTEKDALAYLETLRRHERVTVVEYPDAFNFSAIVNHGVRHARGEMLCIVNNDVEVITPEWLDELASHSMRQEVGVVGCMLYYPDGAMQHAGVVLGLGGVAGHVHLRLPRGDGGYLGRAGVVQNYTAVTGACMMVRREVFEQVSGFDESLPVAFNDIDFCMRVAEAGYFNVWTPYAELYHHESASRGKENTPEKRARFELEVATMKRRWNDTLLNDPAYNPNLALDNAAFELAFPPRIAFGTPAARLPLLLT